jgi:RND family efflux transporter MFP subunit
VKKTFLTRRNVLILVALLIVAALGVAAWQFAGSRTGTTATTTTVRRGSLKSSIETSGRLASRTARSVSSIASGTVKIVAVREGESVKQGDVLVVLDDTPARADIQRAERAVEAAETRVGVARQRAQTDGNALPDVAAAEGDAVNARAALAAANDRLTATLILAPLDGLVGAVRVSEGSNYGAGSEIATITGADDLYVTADLDEVDRPLVSEGQEVTVTVTSFPATPLGGRLAALSATSQSRGGSTVYPVQITIERPATTPLALLPGMTVDVRIVTTARDNILILPSRAIRRAGDRQYVTVRRDNQDLDVEIRTGARSGGDVEIADGLSEGDVVVLR